jgi:hypothetical protein
VWNQFGHQEEFEMKVTTKNGVRDAMGMGIFLVVGLSLGWALAFFHYFGYADVGLGWASRNGPILLIAIAFMVVYGLSFASVSWRSLVTTSLLLLMALFSELLPVGRLLWSFGGILLVTFALCATYNAGKNYVWRGLAVLVGAYTLSVFIYNLYAGDQLTTFFHGGWTT